MYLDVAVQCAVVLERPAACRTHWRHREVPLVVVLHAAMLPQMERARETDIAAGTLETRSIGVELACAAASDVRLQLLLECKLLAAFGTLVLRQVLQFHVKAQSVTGVVEHAALCALETTVSSRFQLRKTATPDCIVCSRSHHTRSDLTVLTSVFNVFFQNNIINKSLAPDVKIIVLRYSSVA